MSSIKSCNFGRIYGRLQTDGKYKICCGSVPSSGDYYTDGKFYDYWKSKKLNNLLNELKNNFEQTNTTWAKGNCDFCPHFVINEQLHNGEMETPYSPITFNIDIINLCDHRCNFCWFWSHDMLEDKKQYEGWNEWAKQKLDFNIFKDTIDSLVELGDCQEIQIGGGGEPLLHPNIHEMINYVKEKTLYKTMNYFPKTHGQCKYMLALRSTRPIVVGTGPAGSGKTVLACQVALEHIAQGKKLVLTRPVVPADEDIGYLPGDLDTKMTPWTKSMYDVLEGRLTRNQIRIEPLAFMRGAPSKTPLYWRMRCRMQLQTKCVCC